MKRPQWSALRVTAFEVQWDSVCKQALTGAGGSYAGFAHPSVSVISAASSGLHHASQRRGVTPLVLFWNFSGHHVVEVLRATVCAWRASVHHPCSTSCTAGVQLTLLRSCAIVLHANGGCGWKADRYEYKEKLQLILNTSCANTKYPHSHAERPVCPLLGWARARLEDGVLDDLGVDGGHAVDRLAPHHCQVRHVHQPALVHNPTMLTGTFHMFYVLTCRKCV